MSTDPRQPAYDAVHAVLREHPPQARGGAAVQNARVWRGVVAALDAMEAPKPVAQTVRGGAVIHQPEDQHHCDPGWEWRASTGEGLYALPAGTRYGVSPDPWRFPRGTVWRCDCGLVWISAGSPAVNMPGVCDWRREGRVERWLRERSERRSEGRR